MAGNEYVTGYQAYETDAEEEAPKHYYGNDEEAPVLLVKNDSSPTARWNHIENLDDFFRRVYTYHQRHGFQCMVVEDILQLLQFLCIILFAGFLSECVDYGILFATKEPNIKHSLLDVIRTPCSCGFSIPLVALFMFIALAFFTSRLLLSLYNISKYWEMKQFYHRALGIESNELDNHTWSEVQVKVIAAQKVIRMCVYTNELTPLDVHHRILRYKNYFVAMINKSVIPVKYRLPLIGQFCFLSHGLKTTLEWLLFWQPLCFNISPFKNPYYLRDSVKDAHRRIRLSEELSNKVLVVALLSLLFSPIILVWQILYFFFVYGSLVKNEPGFLGSRSWSLYARAHLRHFNELHHELNSRLSKAHSVSNEYLSGFMSPLLAIMARFVVFVGGAILVVLICLTVYDEDTLQIEHMLTLMTACGVAVSCARIFIPPENMVFVPEMQMTQILAHTHYQPVEWKDRAHTSTVRDEFGQLFPFKITFLVHEFISPVITPFILLFKLRPKCLEIIDFYRNFTVDVDVVGDICSFAQLDVRKHGNHKWSAPNGDASTDRYLQAENGKTELSLMNFSLNNPMWEPPPESARYLQSIRESAARDAEEGVGGNALTDSVIGWSASRRNGPGSALATSAAGGSKSARVGSMYGSIAKRKLVTSVTQTAGPLTDSPIRGGMIDTMSQSGSLEGFAVGLASTEYNSSEMSISVLYMHELRRRNRHPYMGQTGYETLDTARQVMTQSQLHPVHQFNTLDEEEAGPSSSSPPTQFYHTDS